MCGYVVRLRAFWPTMKDLRSFMGITSVAKDEGWGSTRENTVGDSGLEGRQHRESRIPSRQSPCFQSKYRFCVNSRLLTQSLEE